MISVLFGEKMKFEEMIDILEESLDNVSMENEGADTVRFDIANRSFWVHNDGEIENLNSFPIGFQKKILKLIGK